MEAEKKFKQAADAYRNAKDFDNLTRILLDHLNNPEEAVKVVRESKSVDGAKLVSKFFLGIGDHASAVQFLVMSQCVDEAYRLADEHNKMEIFADVLGDDGTPDQYEDVAKHFELKRQAFLTGKYYYLAQKYDKALGYLLSSGEDTESLKLAIDCVAKSGSESLKQKLINFLLGEIDGLPKDPKFLFRLYLATKMYREAAKTAVIIAREEQNKGSYRLAHDVLVSMYRDLKAERISVSNEMSNNLMLLHSYLIVKPLIKQGEHMKAARMLIRVATSVSRFPAHAVQILTSAVIECSKVGLKGQAYKFAAQLMRPEYRKKIDEKYKKKMESIVRKQDQNGIKDPEEPLTPCPFCDSKIPETDLTCSVCQNSLPYCIVTGRHVVKTDLTSCPRCSFPALHSEFQRIVENGDSCWMCGEKCEPNELTKESDAEKFKL